MDVATIRAMAEEVGYEETFHRASDGILVFESGDDSGTYISIWYHSGTVGTSLPHPRRQRVMSFFFDVDERKLHDILNHPWHNDELHYGGLETLSMADKQIESEEMALKRQLTTLESEESDIAKEKAILQKRLKEIPRSVKRMSSATHGDAGLSELERKKKELAEEIKYLEKQKTKSEQELHTILQQKSRGKVEESDTKFQSQTAEKNLKLLDVTKKAKATSSSSESDSDEEAGQSSPCSSSSGSRSIREFKSAKSIYLNRSVSSVQRDSPGRYKGNRCLYSFSNDEYQEEFAKAWGEKPVGSVALSRGYIIVYEDGGVAWWDIPLQLDQKFRDEDVRLPPIKFASLGPEDHYFVKFVNGKMEWVAKDSFQRAIRNGIEVDGLYVDRVALGPNGSWVISWSNGTTNYEGVPADLAAVIDNANDNGPQVREVNLGPLGEWFAIFSDNSVQANNLPDSLHRALGTIKSGGGRVRSIIFGEISSWYVRYWNGK